MTDKTALVTGAAHRLGKVFALALARRGANIAVHYGGSRDAARRTVEEIAALGVRVEPFQADLAEREAPRELIDAVVGRFGRLDVLVNSAASFESAPFAEITPDAWERVMAVNLRAPFFLTQAAVARMAEVDRPADQPAAVINVSDLSGVAAWREYAHHGVSKAGLVHWTRLAARELAPAVRVNALIPGLILPPPGMDEESDAWEAMAHGVPLQRSGDPRRLGEAVVFLVENDFVTGHVLPVDGGELLAGPVNH
ncbi:MAG: SDR family oxidoreductase [Acidobacteriota bacterium]